MTHDEQRPPGAGIEGGDAAVVRQLGGSVPLQEALKERQDGQQGVTPTKVEDDLLLDPSLGANRFHDAHVFVDDAGGTGNLDGADEHKVLASSLHPR